MSTEPGDGPEPESPDGTDRRSGDDRRRAPRRGLEIPVEKDRRSPGWDRRRGERRKDQS
jgi:hypothetical protein